MGLDVNRFPDAIDDEFKCSICLNVLERPVHGSCGHVFCLTCISVWLESQAGRAANADPLSRPTLRQRSIVGTCPVDRSSLRKEDLVEAALPFRTFLSRLRIKCDNEQFGCGAVVQMGNLKDHIRDCNFNPDEKVECTNGCRCLLPRRYLVRDAHNCLKELKKIIRRQERYILKLEEERLNQLQARRRWKKLLTWLISLMLVVVILMFGPFTGSENLIKAN